MRRWAGLGLFILLLLPAALTTPTGQVDVDSPEQLGLSAFARTVEGDDRELATLFASPAALRGTSEAASLVIVPGLPDRLSSGEAQALASHLETGRSLWLLDETGNGDALTEPAGIRVVPEALLDPDSPLGDARLVEARATLDQRHLDILLTAATVLEVNQTRATILARSTEAFRDVDRSGEIEEGDPGGNHPVIATTTVDGAQLLVASDTGLFTNALMGADGYQNQALLEDLLATTPDGGVVLDTTRQEPARAMAPMKAATGLLLTATTDPVAAAGLLLAAVILGWALVQRAPSKATWGGHVHDLGRPRAADQGEQHERLRRLLVHRLRETVGQDASELIAMGDDELEALAREHLGDQGQYLSGRGEIGARFRTLLPEQETGGTSP
ncbi:MAG: hypothetical protein R3185_00345 [Candidatus Thermoplasmatota archaeon]|nr:hypothetical protein [Candidatus Thermoplasmatota archaeon]